MARAAVAALVLALACVAHAQTQTTTPTYIADTLQPQTVRRTGRLLPTATPCKFLLLGQPVALAQRYCEVCGACWPATSCCSCKTLCFLFKCRMPTHG